MLPGGERRPIGGVTAEWRGQDHNYDIHQEDVLAIHERWRRIADRYDAMLVGEVYELNPERLARYVSRDGLHSSFWFGLVESAWDPARAHTTLLAAARASARLCWVQGNHDRPRSVTRYGGGQLGRARSLALLTVLALLPGTPFLYQGEELGLADGVVDAEATRDPLGRADPSVSRDGARTPMPWSAVPGLGFTSAPAAWIPDGDRSAEDTVAVQDKGSGSHLNAVRRLLRLRGELLLADRTTWSPLELAGLLAYRRAGVLVLANLTDEPVRLDPAPAGATLFDTHAGRSDPSLLAANQAVIIEAP